MRQINLLPLYTVLTLVFCLFLAGCGGPINQANYDKIQDGMSLSEVEAILGKGKEQASTGGSFGGFNMNSKTMVWQDGSKIISVGFLNGEVIGKSQIGL